MKINKCNIKYIMFFLIVIFGVLVISIYIQTKKLIAIGVELSDKAEPFSRIVDDSDMRILVMGDSSAVGVGADFSKDSIAGRIAQDYPNASIVNQAINGAKTHEVFDQFPQSSSTFNIVHLQIGGNDIVRFTNLDELETSIDRLLDAATNYADTVFLLTSGNVGTSKLLPFGTRWAYTQRTKAVRSIFMKAAKKYGVVYIDIFRSPKNDPYYQNPEIYYSPDFFHPSSKGYEDWYGFVKQAYTNQNINVTK